MASPLTPAVPGWRSTRRRSWLPWAHHHGPSAASLASTQQVPVTAHCPRVCQPSRWAPWDSIAQQLGSQIKGRPFPALTAPAVPAASLTLLLGPQSPSPGHPPACLDSWTLGCRNPARAAESLLATPSVTPGTWSGLPQGSELWCLQGGLQRPDIQRDFTQNTHLILFLFF